MKKRVCKSLDGESSNLKKAVWLFSKADMVGTEEKNRLDILREGLRTHGCHSDFLVNIRNNCAHLMMYENIFKERNI